LQYTASFRLPEPRNLIWSSKNSHTAFAAAQLLWAYEALGDEKYLQAAKRTADMYLTVQDPAQGYWVHSYYYENGRYLPGDTKPLIQDHCQTAPLFLLAYMYRVTQDRRYLQAAIKNADFLVQAQNPNGSWPHHYDPIRRIGLGQGEIIGQGEVNDYGTSGPIEALLAMAHFTNQPRYRDAALNGANWLAAALIETNKVVGWAGQYSDKNQPLPARHHEPAAVTQYAARWAAKGLIAAFRETQDDKYLLPLRKTIKWFDENKEQGGWWWDYDVSSGRPIRMVKRQIYFLDDPEQLKAYILASGGTPTMRGDWVNVEQLRREVRDASNNPQGKVQPQPSRDDLRKYVETTAPRYVASFIEADTAWNPVAGLYTFPSDSGLSTDLVRHQVVRFCDLLMRARAARGDIPADNPLFRHTEAFVGWNKVLHQPKPQNNIFDSLTLLLR
jgi:rhamnogalacturonyl hydrolase YesR